VRWLVTGGAGFIGSHVVDAIVRCRPRDEVVVFDNFYRGRREHLAQHLENERVTVLEGDILDTAAVAKACLGVEVVLHLAARSNVLGSEQHLTEACETNVLGTVNVLNAALTAGVTRVVFSSSREVYGDPQSLPVSEEAPLAPKNLYGASKVAGEVYCSIFRHRGLDVRVLRFSNVFGPRDYDRVIPLWLERAGMGLPLQVFGGQQVLDFVWIDLVVSAVLKAAQLPDLPGPINVGCGLGVPILTLAERIIQASGTRSATELLPARDQEVVGFTADITKMRKLLEIDPSGDPLLHLATMTIPVSGS
jgi:UDP-glucose 4-epimerase